ncbi:hypothetical protein HAX54_051378 [Datura stramonium]|uniref:Uncharacterized protein n=1 Tax=Datura stramonium TaxID=4076 RepID=A0ABS8WME2_DATST|nr:hypothetical protein [Datura stramonium]
MLCEEFQSMFHKDIETQRPLSIRNLMEELRILIPGSFTHIGSGRKLAKPNLAFGSGKIQNFCNPPSKFPDPVKEGNVYRRTPLRSCTIQEKEKGVGRQSKRQMGKVRNTIKRRSRPIWSLAIHIPRPGKGNLIEILSGYGYKRVGPPRSHKCHPNYPTSTSSHDASVELSLPRLDGGSKTKADALEKILRRLRWSTHKGKR